MVAGSMLAISMTALSMTIRLGLSFYADQRQKTTALHAAEAKMEQLLQKYETDADLSAGTHTQNYDLNGNPVASGGFFTATWVVTNNAPIDDVRSIALTMSWTSAVRTRAFTLETIRK